MAGQKLDLKVNLDKKGPASQTRGYLLIICTTHHSPPTTHHSPQGRRIHGLKTVVRAQIAETPKLGVLGALLYKTGV